MINVGMPNRYVMENNRTKARFSKLLTIRPFIAEFGDRLDGHLWKSICTKCNTGSMGSLKSAT
ncbi:MULTISPECIES: hypothetical protein [Xenorhabdus]|uniref:hypothetical protein n=1 Tax=Xenorhabdus TaxID=626 RepID=UPI00128D15D7|nr:MULTISPECIES: hypothetical protein [Xenorhabdus]WFQ79342.1 hypothetical protein PXH59_17435 [Xenorhabdus sp. SF857]